MGSSPARGTILCARGIADANPRLMKERIGLLYALPLGLAMCLFLASVGCEDNAEPEVFNDAGDVSPLTIRPTRVTLVDENTASFTASGGTLPYQWSVSDSSLGTVPASQGSVVTYTRIAGVEGANQVIVMDRNGWSTFAVVQQIVTNQTATTSP